MGKSKITSLAHIIFSLHRAELIVAGENQITWYKQGLCRGKLPLEEGTE